MSASNELEGLRTANAELTEKSRTRKAKIVELENQVAELTGKLEASNTALHDATISAPLRQLATVVSPVPELWTIEFQKHYKLEMRDGRLTLLDSNGEPVMDGKEPVEFTPNSIAKLVTDENNEDLTVFRHITAGSLASGGGATADRGSTFPTIDSPKKALDKSTNMFGLR
jgi:hypothetical protein